MMKSENYFGAAEEIKSSNTLANICGSICPAEIFCQAVCSRAQIDEPVAIRKLHDFATTWEANQGCRWPDLTKLTPLPAVVAIVGAGPAGLSCAFELRKLGVVVTLFDSNPTPGGVPVRLIPRWRLPAKVLNHDLDFLFAFLPPLEVLREPISLATLKKKYRVIYLATGLWRDRRLNIPGEDLPKVYHAMDYLNLTQTAPEEVSHFRRIAVVGGGNVSLDVATSAKRLGADEVILLYRRSPLEMKTWQAEKQAATAVGVQFAFQTQPVAILSTGGHVSALRCLHTEMSAERDASGRRIAVPIPSSETDFPADAVLIAIGQDSTLRLDLPLQQTANGRLLVDENGSTSAEGIFAGGDLIRGEGTVVQAVADGKQAAHAINKYLADDKWKRKSTK